MAPTDRNSRTGSVSKLPFAITVSLSSFLLFLIQPVIAKRILPWFGGATAVWITCLLFFQAALLAGYLYAHLLVRLRPRAQTIVHAALLLGSLSLLPVAPGIGWKPSADDEPALRILLLLSATIGVPYVLLSATSPLVQTWYSRSGTVLPYRLFALSNLASIVALLAYPVLVEPRIGTTHQLLSWSGAYAVFAGLCAFLAIRAGAPSANAAPAPDGAISGDAAPAPLLRERALWLALAACGSALLLGATNHLTQDVAAIPFLWVLPLSLYLLTFVIAFDHERWYRPSLGLVLLAIALCGMSYGLLGIPNRGAARIGVPVYSLGLFLCCLFCHGELARRKPSARHLTSFYLMLALGGALGAFFVSVLAPHLFSAFYEFPLTMLACAALALALRWHGGPLPLAICIATIAAVCFFGIRDVSEIHDGSRLIVRNFYGGLKVMDWDDEGDLLRELVNGTINHGMQFRDSPRHRLPITYYGPGSGIALAIDGKKEHYSRGIRVGVVGLGTGTIAAYGRPGDVYRFYEINPLVPGIARSWFTYLNDSAAKIEIAPGDARLSLEREPPERFDVLAIDAFSSDSIPVHLLTVEAIRLYFRHLQPDGVLALHISNANVDLAPVAASLADSVSRLAWLVETPSDDDAELFATDWVLIYGQPPPGAATLVRRASLLSTNPRFRPWTDDYSNLFQVLK